VFPVKPTSGRGIEKHHVSGSPLKSAPPRRLPNPRFSLSCAAPSLVFAAESEIPISGSPQRTKPPTSSSFRSSLRASGGHLPEISPASFRLSLLFTCCFARSGGLVHFACVCPYLAGLAFYLRRFCGKIQFWVVE
jgi:hypothetical protein